MMEGTVNIPGAGPMPKKAVVAVVVITGAIVAVSYYRHSKASAAAAPADPAAVDPALDPGANLAAGADPGAVYGYGYNPFGGSQGPVPDAPVPVTTTQFTTNGDWAQAAEAYLVENSGADPATVGNALGKYITGQRITSGQQEVISSAIAFFNYPPVAGANNRPPSMNVAPAGNPPPPPSHVAVNPVAGLHVTDDGFTSITIDWRASQHATGYLVTTLQNGKQVHQSHTAGTKMRIGNLKRKTRYDFRVRAQPGGTGGHDANVTATTK